MADDRAKFRNRAGLFTPFRAFLQQVSKVAIDFLLDGERPGDVQNLDSFDRDSQCFRASVKLFALWNAE